MRTFATIAVHCTCTARVSWCRKHSVSSVESFAAAGLSSSPPPLRHSNSKRNSNSSPEMKVPRRLRSSVPSSSTSSSSSSFALSEFRFPQWNTTEYWCNLCKEPFNSWNEHRGKRDHICMQMVYEAIAREHRLWNAEQVLTDFGKQWGSNANQNSTMATLSRKQEKRMERLARQECADHRRNINQKKEEVQPFDRWREDPTHVSRSGCDLGALLKSFDLAYERPRRQQLLDTLYYLHRHAKLISFGEQQKTWFPEYQPWTWQYQGILVLFKSFHIPLVRLFPRSDQKDISGLSQMIASSYNHETAFDLLGLESICTAKMFAANGEADLTYVMKASAVRALLGQLRWAIDPESAAPVPRSSGVSECDHIVAGIAGRELLCELVFCKLSEYICRVEPVWREYGDLDRCCALPSERSNRRTGLPSLAQADDGRDPFFVASLPSLDTTGMGRFTGDLHSADFGLALRQDPRMPKRKPVKYFFDRTK